MGPVYRLTREELYSKVWSTPVSKLAKEYGLSDVGLAKICERHGIPRPRVGHWSRISHGQSVKQEALPPNPPDQSEVIEIEVDDLAADANVADRYDDTRSEFNRIQLAVSKCMERQFDRLRHPKTLAMQKLRKELSPDSQGRLSWGRYSIFGVRVSAGMWDRALKIMDKILVVAEELGYKLGEEKRGETELNVLGGNISIGLLEKIEMTEATLSAKSNRTFVRDEKQYEYLPKGILTLSIKNVYLGSARVNWSDNNKARLEDQISDFFEGMIEVVARLRARSEKWEETRRLENEAQRLHEEQAEREELERERIEELIADAENWRKASVLRAFIAAREKAMEVSGKSDGKELLEWIGWAKDVADSIDPLIEMTTRKGDDS